MKAIQSTTGSGGISHLDAKYSKRVIFNKCFRSESARIVNSLTDFTNKPSATEIKGETALDFYA